MPIDDDGALSLIHVKAAHIGSLGREIAVGAYEVVTSQAAKNAVYLDVRKLRSHMATAPVRAPAAWTRGQRVADRSEFLEALDCRSASDTARVIILQPHVMSSVYRRLGADLNSGGPALARLHLLETLLNSARAAVVGQGADMEVWGSDA